MKYLIASDIHGSLNALDRILDYYDRHNFDMLLLLGDILNYGPRNGVPADLNAPAIAERLNARADSIICVRGNCDSEVDQMLLHFDLLATYAVVVDSGKRIFLTHGHIYPTQQMPAGRYDAIFYGHTHLQGISQAPSATSDATTGTTLLVNTGSPTFPKGDNPPTFATLCDGTVSIHHLDGSVLTQHAL